MLGIVLPCVVAGGVASGGESTALPLLWAQFDPTTTSAAPTEGAFNWQMPAKIGAIVALALVICMISYYVIYPTVLRWGRVWPVTLFGRCSALAWFLTSLVVLAVLWDDLVFADEFGGVNFWREHGGRLAVVAVGVVFAVAWMYLWRSDVPQKSTATQLAQ